MERRGFTKTFEARDEEITSDIESIEVTKLI